MMRQKVTSFLLGLCFLAPFSKVTAGELPPKESASQEDPDDDFHRSFDPERVKLKLSKKNHVDQILNYYVIKYAAVPMIYKTVGKIDGVYKKRFLELKKLAIRYNQRLLIPEVPLIHGWTLRDMRFISAMGKSRSEQELRDLIHKKKKTRKKGYQSKKRRRQIIKANRRTLIDLAT